MSGSADDIRVEDGVLVITGSVDDVDIASGRLTMAGVAEDVTIAGHTEATIIGVADDVTLVAGTLRLDGTIDDLTIHADGTVYLNLTEGTPAIGGDAKAEGALVMVMVTSGKANVCDMNRRLTLLGDSTLEVHVDGPLPNVGDVAMKILATGGVRGAFARLPCSLSRHSALF